MYIMRFADSARMRRRSRFDWIKWLALPGALVALIALWQALGLPTPALSTDIQRLDRQQADVAVQMYQTKLRSLLAIVPPSDGPAKSAWTEELSQTRDQLKRAEDRKIELSK